MINLSTILRNGEKVMKLVPVFKDLLPDKGNTAESSLLHIIKQKDDALYAKKNEIEILKKKIRKLEEYLAITEDELDDAKRAGGSWDYV